MTSKNLIKNPAYASQVWLVVVVNFLLVVTTLALIGLVINFHTKTAIQIEGTVENVEVNRFYYTISLKNDHHSYFLPCRFVENPDKIMQLIDEKLIIIVLKEPYLNNYQNIALYGLISNKFENPLLLTTNYLILYKQLITLFSVLLGLIIINSLIIMKKWWKTPQKLLVCQKQKELHEKIGRKISNYLSRDFIKKTQKLIRRHTFFSLKLIRNIIILLLCGAAIIYQSVVLLIVIVIFYSIFNVVIYVLTNRQNEIFVYQYNDLYQCYIKNMDGIVVPDYHTSINNNVTITVDKNEFYIFEIDSEGELIDQVILYCDAAFELIEYSLFENFPVVYFIDVTYYKDISIIHSVKFILTPQLFYDLIQYCVDIKNNVF